MTENEIKNTKEWFEDFIEAYALSNQETIEFQKAVECLEEIQAYRAIGTVEEIQKKMEELERWHTDRINENIKNPFAYTSTSICHNCDHKDEYIEELEAENAEYNSIGTIEEFKALKEKSEPKKIIAKKKTKSYLGTDYYCPTCDERQLTAYAISKGDDYCKDCGQKLDWE